MTRGAGAYARAIERAWSSAALRPVVFSPSDWARVAEWHARGIPLEIVLEALREAAERGRKRGAEGGPRRLTYLAPAVEESWSTVVDGRTLEPAARDDRGVTPAAEAGGGDGWRRLLAAEPAGSPLASLLGELLEALAAGGRVPELERELDRRLPVAVSAELLAGVDREIGARLDPYRDRMSPALLDKTRHRARVARLRGRLGLRRSSPV